MNKADEKVRNFKEESINAASKLLKYNHGNIKKIKDLATGKIYGYFLRSEIGIDKENHQAEFALNISINDEYKGGGKAKNTFPRTMRTFGIRHLDNDYDKYVFQRIIDFERDEIPNDLNEVSESFAYYMEENTPIDHATAKKWLTKAILQAQDYYKDMKYFRAHIITNVLSSSILV